MTSETTHKGHCLCGKISFKAHGKPIWTAYCHCASCRRHTASPVAMFVAVPAADFAYTAQPPAVFESSPKVWRSFCATCGTPLTYHADRFPGEMHIYVGALDNPEDYAPRGHVFYAERLPWFETADGLKRVAGTSNDV